MKVSTELANVLKQACQEVNSWEPWQRSRDPQGADGENSRMRANESNALYSGINKKLEA
jgi:hypothetical protein